MNDEVDMKCYCGILTKEDKVFLVNPFLKLENEPILLNSNEYVEVSPSAYLRIINKLDLHRTEPECVIYYDATLNPSILQDSDIKEIEKPELSVQDKLEKEKTHFIRVMGDSIGDKMSISNFALFNFFKLNHYLASKGYFITDENREEEYLKVINSGDADVLEKLSEYLDALDEFNAIDEAYKSFKEFKDRIDGAIDEKELRAIYDEFAKTF
jgi:hypothetical protein